jgi:hypothetical protein
MPEQLQGRSDAASQQPGPHQYQQLVDESDVSRTAYTFSVLHTRKDATRITALALDPRAQRLFIGLSNGWVCLVGGWGQVCAVPHCCQKALPIHWGPAFRVV